MTGSASQAMDVVFRLLLGEKIVGRGSRGREGLGIGPPPEAGGFFQPIFFTVFAMLQELILRIKGSLAPTTSPRAPEELPRPFQEPPKRPQELSKRLQEDPKDAPRAPKEVS